MKEFNLLGINVSLQEFADLMEQQSLGKELVVVDNKVVAIDHVMSEKEELNIELKTLYRWFEEYDNQVKQYERCQRLGVTFDKDIADLDNQAQTKAARITEIRDLLKE